MALQKTVSALPAWAIWVLGLVVFVAVIRVREAGGIPGAVPAAVAFLVVMGIQVLAFVDAVRRPRAGWERLEQPRWFWMPLLSVAVLLPVIGLAAAVPYLRTVGRIT